MCNPLFCCGIRRPSLAAILLVDFILPRKRATLPVYVVAVHWAPIASVGLEPRTTRINEEGDDSRRTRIRVSVGVPDHTLMSCKQDLDVIDDEVLPKVARVFSSRDEFSESG